MTYTPPSRESIYLALFQLVSTATYQGSPAFITASRTIKSLDQVNAAEKPALFQLQGIENWKQNPSGLPYVADAIVELYVFASQPDTSVDIAPQLNNLVDAVIATLFSFPNVARAASLGRVQTLGGLVQSVTLRGKAEYYIGLSGQINAFAVLPITICMANLQQGV